MFANFYRGKRVLVTGHTGFKGAWLSLWLSHLGARVWGYSLAPPTRPNFHELIAPGVFAGETVADIREVPALAKAVRRVKPEMIFHLAAQALVRVSYLEPLATLQTNALGTANLLEVVRQAGRPCTLLIVTSDKCYENREWEHAYRENDPLGGHDVYSMSKAAAELIAQSWDRAFFQPGDARIRLATARAGNVIGGGDYARDRIVPDCVRALLRRQPILVRHPTAVRPWQHVLESLSGYLWLGAKLAGSDKNSPLSGAFNFGPESASRRPVRELVESVLRHWPGEWTDGSDPRQPHEARWLGLAIDKAATWLQWQPSWDFDEAVIRTVEWYRERHLARRSDLLAFSLAQIEAYAQAARQKRLPWAATATP